VSNTVHLYALTGERREGKSLSTASDVAARFAKKLYQEHNLYVPIVWHDVDYPLARLVGEGRAEYDYPAFGPVNRILEAVVALGGTAYTRLVRGWPSPWNEQAPVTWRLPAELDLSLLDAWLAKVANQVSCD